MKIKITTILFLLTSVGFAVAGEGSKFQPTPANKTAPVVSHICDQQSLGKTKSRTPHAAPGHKTAGLFLCSEHSKRGSYTPSDWTRHY